MLNIKADAAWNGITCNAYDNKNVLVEYRPSRHSL